MYKAIVAHGAHSAPLAARFFDNELEPTDNLDDINIAIRIFDTKAERGAYILGIWDASDDYRVLTAGEYRKLQSSIRNKTIT
jgi:hypothetical protein